MRNWRSGNRCCMRRKDRIAAARPQGVCKTLQNPNHGAPCENTNISMAWVGGERDRDRDRAIFDAKI